MSRFRRVTFQFLLLLPLALCSISFAEEPEKIEKVVVTGMGVDADKARQNAIRNAVEQVIGAYVTSDTMVKDSQLIKDEILSYSGGFVKESRIVSTEKSDDGLFSVKLEALVVATKLKRKIQALNIATKKVEGESLFGEAFSKIEQKKGGAELLGKILAKYPQAAYQIEVGKPGIADTDHNRDKAQIGIPIAIKWDSTFLGELKDVLSKSASREFKSVKIESFMNGTHSDVLRANQVVCIATNASKRSGRADVCYGLDKSLTDTGDKRRKVSTLLNLPVTSETYSLYFAFKDGSGKTVETATYKFSRDDDYRKRPSNIEEKAAVSAFLKGLLGDGGEESEATGKKKKNKTTTRKEDYSDPQTATYLEQLGEGFHPPNILWKDLYNKHLMLVEDGVMRMTVSLGVDVNVLKDVVKIEVSMNGFE